MNTVQEGFVFAYLDINLRDHGCVSHFIKAKIWLDDFGQMPILNMMIFMFKHNGGR
jgi:hypothetical protein